MRSSVIAFFSGISLWGCSGTAVAPAPIGKPDVVVVTIDTVRADRIGAYGYTQGSTPNIDALAEAGARFTRAYSVLPLTIPTHASMFTGLLPFSHNIRGNGDNVLADEFTTLAEHLSGNGYATAASVAAFVTTRQWGFAQGFDAYFDSMPEADEGADKNFWHTERDGAIVVSEALDWLAGQPADKPVFLWVHLYDAHFPYEPRAGFDALKERPYDSEIAYVDSQIGRLVGAFEGREVVWSVIADHGESLGEHHETTHGMFTYDSTQHIPWVLSGAGVKPAVIDTPVSNVDLTPTLLRHLGLPIPEGLDGRPQPGSDTTPYLEAYQITDRFQVAPHRTVVAGDLKLIDTPRPELYDLRADPRERTNLAESRPDDVARLRALMLATGAKHPSGELATAMDGETQAQLAALGYIAPSAGAVDYAALPDPKDFIPVFEALARLDRSTQKGDIEASNTAVDTILKLRPESFEMHMRKLTMLNKQGRTADMRVFLEEMRARFDAKPQVWVTLANLAMQDGATEQALEYARAALSRDANASAAQEIEVYALFRLHRPEEAVARGKVYMEQNPKNAGVAAYLGKHYLGVQDFKEAERYLRVAVSDAKPRRGSRTQLALLAMAASARQDAYLLLEAEVKDYPGSVRAHRLLAKLYAEDQRWIDQRPHAELVARNFPKEAAAQRALAQCLFNLNDYAEARRVLNTALDAAPDDPDVLLLHANLLAKEGKADEGKAVFERASALHAARVKDAEAKAKAAPKPAPKAAATPTLATP